MQVTNAPVPVSLAAASDLVEPAKTKELFSLIATHLSNAIGYLYMDGSGNIVDKPRTALLVTELGAIGLAVGARFDGDFYPEFAKEFQTQPIDATVTVAKEFVAPVGLAAAKWVKHLVTANKPQ